MVEFLSKHGQNKDSNLNLLLSEYFCIHRLFTMEGEPVVSPSQLISGNSYVAANKERFKRCEYFTPQDFGASPKLNRRM